MFLEIKKRIKFYSKNLYNQKIPPKIGGTDWRLM